MSDIRETLRPNVDYMAGIFSQAYADILAEVKNEVFTQDMQGVILDFPSDEALKERLSRRVDELMKASGTDG